MTPNLSDPNINAKLARMRVSETPKYPTKHQAEKQTTGRVARKKRGYEKGNTRKLQS